MESRESDSLRPFVVVGGGSTGMAAADEAARCGLAAMVLDDALPAGSPGTSVLSITADGEILWASGETSGTFHARGIVLATGASPRSIPFPGWTLPGVVAMRSLDARSIRRGEQVVVAGTASDRLRALARRLKDEGVEIVAILDANGPIESDREVRDVPVLVNHAVFAAIGEDEVRSVVVGPVDPISWHPDRARSRTIAANRLILDFGDAPRDELAVLAGCAMEFDPASGGWHPQHDEDGRTSVPGVFWAGTSQTKARMAALSAAEDAGVISRGQAVARRGEILAQPIERGDPGAILAGLFELAEDDTIVCRCEHATLSAMRTAVDQGASEMTSLKMATRVGMGACQGRECGIAASWLLARLSGKVPASLGRINPRPPARPVTLGALAGMARETLPPAVEIEEAS